ncbi:hypothetical protein [Chitinophaga defluvii]|uniref:Uncharacterized protein n=1 Tax=Chitinophaga defluvii TaxID=3163343 RepID=A0ABV2TF47_9BACT
MKTIVVSTTFFVYLFIDMGGFMFILPERATKYKAVKSVILLWFDKERAMV